MTDEPVVEEAEVMDDPICFGEALEACEGDALLKQICYRLDRHFPSGEATQKAEAYVADAKAAITAAADALAPNYPALSVAVMAIADGIEVVM